MTRVRLLLLAGLFAPLAAVPPSAPGPVIPPAMAEVVLAPLFASLAAQRAVYARFTEKRWFGFRKTPTVLEGEMRFDPDHGLSLRYLRPEPRLMIVDQRGLVLRDDHGRSRELPADPRGTSIERALLPALGFNLAEIQSAFTVQAALDAADWRLDLTPNDAVLAKAMGRLIIQGSGTVVHQLEFHRSGNQRVVIEITASSAGVTFSRDELRRYFR